MQEVYDFLKKCGTYYLATLEVIFTQHLEGLNHT